MNMSLSQQLMTLAEMREELEAAGVLHIDSVFDGCRRDEQRDERIARRYNRTACAKACNDWLNQNGIYLRRPETWPKPPPRLSLFKKGAS